jgi:hypothetical protein
MFFYIYYKKIDNLLAKKRIKMSTNSYHQKFLELFERAQILNLRVCDVASATGVTNSDIRHFKAFVPKQDKRQVNLVSVVEKLEPFIVAEENRILSTFKSRGLV